MLAANTAVVAGLEAPGTVRVMTAQGEVGQCVIEADCGPSS